MKTIKSCKYNMDTACVEVVYANGTVLSINTISLENVIAATVLDCSELDWLIYNKPWEYVNLVLSDGLESYLSYGHEHLIAD